jgi:phosphatidylinositol-3,4,5-trisphosphate 3-phosphatase/dual-specificity protein phosphatase PTEN
MTSVVRKLVSKKKKRFVDEKNGFNLDLTYITPRIIAMGFPSTGIEAVYRNPMPEVQRFFKTRHEGHYKIINLCSER